jgi:hypothetical protein
MPPLLVQQDIVAGIEAERKAVEECRGLVEGLTKKIERCIMKVWGLGKQENGYLRGGEK